MTASAYLPDTGDVIWTDFDPTKGREQAGRHPALVVSPAAFTENTGLAIVCPITSRVRPFPTSVVLPSSLPITGEILTSHIRSIDIRSIDTQARPIRYAGIAVSDVIARLVRAKLDTFITI
jgi:mRNA interferase MazF